MYLLSLGFLPMVVFFYFKVYSTICLLEVNCIIILSIIQIVLSPPIILECDNSGESPEFDETNIFAKIFRKYNFKLSKRFLLGFEYCIATFASYFVQVILVLGLILVGLVLNDFLSNT